jgi:sec-independent protein translocase protein TatB
MFDMSFLELIVIAVVGLLVLGPERLPGAIRTGSLYIGRIKRTVNKLRYEIEHEIGAGEIQNTLKNEATNQIESDIAELKKNFQHTISSAQGDIAEGSTQSLEKTEADADIADHQLCTKNDPH